MGSVKLFISSYVLVFELQEDIKGFERRDFVGDIQD